MGIFKKLKNIFFKEEEETKEIQEYVPQEVPQPKGELVGQCALCAMAIGAEDNVSQLGTNTVHKRCFKKARKLMFQGLSQEDIVKRLQR
jgi:hypothetical protein